MELAGILVSILIRAVIVCSGYTDNKNVTGSSNAADTAPVEFFFSFVGCGRNGALTGDSNVGVYIIASGGQSEPAAGGTRVRVETATAMTSTGSGLHRQATTARSEDSRQVIYDTVVHRERSSYLTFPADRFGCAVGTSRSEANIGDIGKSYVGNAGIRIIADGPIDVWAVIGCQPSVGRQCVSRHVRPINESTGLRHVVLASPVVDDVTGTRLLIHRRIVVEASADDTVVLVNTWFSHRNHTTSAMDSKNNSNAADIAAAHSVTIGAFQTLVIELDEDESMTKGQDLEITSTKPVSVVLESTTTPYTDDDVTVTQLEPTDRWSTIRGPLYLPKQLKNTTSMTFVRVIGGRNTSTVRIQYGEHQSDAHTEQFSRLCPADGEVAVGSAADLEGDTEHVTNRSSVTVESPKNSCVYWYLDVNLSRDENEDDDNLVWVSADGPVSVLHLIVPHGQRSSSSKHAANRSVPVDFASSITVSSLTNNSTLQTDSSEHDYSVNKPEVDGDEEESDRDVLIFSSSCEATGSSVIVVAVFDKVDRIKLDGRDCNSFEYSEHSAGAVAGNQSVTLLYIRCKVDVGLYLIVFQFARRKNAAVGRVFVGCCSCTDGVSHARHAASSTELISTLSLESEAGQSLKREAIETSPSFLIATAAAVRARSKRIESPSPLRVIDVSTTTTTTTTTTTELNATRDDDVYRRLEITPVKKMTAGYMTTLAHELANNDVTTVHPSAAEKLQTASGTAASETVTGQLLNSSFPVAIDSVAVTDSFNGSDRNKVVTPSNLCGKNMPAGVLCKAVEARSYNYSDVNSSGLQVLKVLVPKDETAAGSRNVADAMMSQRYHYNTDDGMHESDSGGSGSSIIVILSSPTVIAVIASLAAAIFFVIACIVGFVIAELFCTKGGLQRVKVSPFVDDYD